MPGRCTGLGVPRLRSRWRFAAADERAWEDETRSTAGSGNNSGGVGLASTYIGVGLGASSASSSRATIPQVAGWTSGRGVARQQSELQTGADH